MHKINIAVLGATCAVGQRFVELVTKHPFFEIRALLASENSVGKKYKDACTWLASAHMPESCADMVVREAVPASLAYEHIPIVFSALPTDTAKIVESEFAKAGYYV